MEAARGSLPTIFPLAWLAPITILTLLARGDTDEVCSRVIWHVCPGFRRGGNCCDRWLPGWKCGCGFRLRAGSDGHGVLCGTCFGLPYQPGCHVGHARQ